MTAAAGCLALVGGVRTTQVDPRSVARLAGRAARGLGLATTLLTTDEQCLAWAAAQGWQACLVARADTAELLAACEAVRPRPSLLLADGPDAVLVTAEVAAALGLSGPAPQAVTDCLDPVATRGLLAAAGLAVCESPAGGPAAEGLVVGGLAAGDTGGADEMFLLLALDGELVGVVREVVAPDGTRGYDCSGDPRRRGRILRAQASAALRALRLPRGPAQVRLAWNGRQARILGVAPGLPDALVATLLQLTTGVDVIGAAVAAAVTGSRDAKRRTGRAPVRHACLRFGAGHPGGGPGGFDLNASDPGTPAALGVPGVVVAARGRAGWVLTVAQERAVAAAAAQTAARALGLVAAAPATRPAPPPGTPVAALSTVEPAAPGTQEAAATTQGGAR